MCLLRAPLYISLVATRVFQSVNFCRVLVDWPLMKFTIGWWSVTRTIIEFVSTLWTANIFQPLDAEDTPMVNFFYYFCYDITIIK